MEDQARIRQRRPSDDCHASKEELLNQKKHQLDVTDDCPICESYGILCFVGSHPSDADVVIEAKKFVSSPQKKVLEILSNEAVDESKCFFDDSTSCLLNRVLISINLNIDQLNFGDVDRLQQSYHNSELKVPFPATVNTDEHICVDLRLPHDNPLLVGDNHPLKNMAKSLLESTAKHAVILGSSGCGKTTTAFLVAQQCFSIYIEACDEFSTRYGYRVVAADLFARHNGAMPSFDDVQRRVHRCIVARVLALAIIFRLRQRNNMSTLTSYQWLLFTLTKLAKVLFADISRDLQDGFNVDNTCAILSAVGALIGGEVLIIFDEAHLLAGFKDFVYKKVDSEVGVSLTSMQAVVGTMNAISDSIRGIIYSGTQVAIQEQVRIASTVFKTSNETMVLVVGEYPLIGSGFEDIESGFEESASMFSVKDTLDKCLVSIPDDIMLQQICFQLQGRPRFVSFFLQKLIHKNFNVKGALQAVNSNTTLLKEICRVIASDLSVGVDHLLGIWCSYIKHVDIETFPSFSLSWSGTLAFTRCVKGSPVYFDQNENSTISFSHCIREPLLISAIEAYFAQEGIDPYYALYKYCVEEMKKMEAGPRGVWLDFLVLAHFICKSRTNPTLLSNIFPELKGPAALFCVTRLVGGPSMLNKWVRLILTDPEGEVVPGLKARNAAVRPESNAGADGVFAAFDDGNIVFVSIVCTWRDRITKGKSEGQYSKGDLINQFQGRNAMEGVLNRRREELKGIFTENADRIDFIRVVVELGDDSKASPEQGIILIDNQNVMTVLGFNTTDFN